jgi:hypothetical protein
MMTKTRAPSAKRGSRTLLILTLLWTLGTPTLVGLWLKFGFYIDDDSEAPNLAFGEACLLAALVLGLGAPAAACIVAAVHRRRRIATAYALTVAAIAWPVLFYYLATW